MQRLKWHYISQTCCRGTVQTACLVCVTGCRQWYKVTPETSRRTEKCCSNSSRRTHIWFVIFVHFQSINQSINLYRAIVQRRVLQCGYAESKRNVLRQILCVNGWSSSTVQWKRVPKSRSSNAQSFVYHLSKSETRQSFRGVTNTLWACPVKNLGANRIARHWGANGEFRKGYSARPFALFGYFLKFRWWYTLYEDSIWWLQFVSWKRRDQNHPYQVIEWIKKYYRFSCRRFTSNWLVSRSLWLDRVSQRSL